MLWQIIIFYLNIHSSFSTVTTLSQTNLLQINIPFRRREAQKLRVLHKIEDSLCSHRIFDRHQPYVFEL